MDVDGKEDQVNQALEKIVYQLKADFDGEVFEQLLHQFQPLVSSCYSARRLAYLDYSDYVQEARVTMWKAIYSYDGAIPFKSYFKIVLIRHLSHLHRYELAAKRIKAADCVSLDVDVYVREHLEGQIDTLSPLSQSHCLVPDEWVIARAKSDGYFARLSAWEREVFLASLEGLSVSEIAQAKGKSYRSCQSALYRCRRKLEDF